MSATPVLELTLGCNVSEGRRTASRYTVVQCTQHCRSRVCLGLKKPGTAAAESHAPHVSHHMQLSHRHWYRHLSTPAADPPQLCIKQACRLLADTYQTASACVCTFASYFCTVTVSCCCEQCRLRLIIVRAMYPTIHSNSSVGVPAYCPAHSGRDSRETRSATANEPPQLVSSPSSSNALPVLRVQIADQLSISPPVSPLQF